MACSEQTVTAMAVTATTRLHRKLSAFDTLLLTLSCLSPVFSVYGPGSDVLQRTGTGAAALFLIGVGVAAIWGVVYAELGSAYPYAGGDYVGVGSILGPAAGFVCLALWALTVLPVSAFLVGVQQSQIGFKMALVVGRQLRALRRAIFEGGDRHCAGASTA